MARPAFVTVEWHGEEWLLVDLARKYRIHRDTLQSRLQAGMSITDALMKPARPYTPKSASKYTPKVALHPMERERLLRDAIDLLIDASEAIEPLGREKPRWAHTAQAIRHWLQRVALARSGT